MLQILTKVFGIKSCNDTNQELHGKLPQLYAKGHYSENPHFVLNDSYLSEYTIIMICSFLDEYNNHFTVNNCPEFKERIIKFRKQIKPVLTRINQWTDLHKYRGLVLAHNLRTTTKESVFNFSNPINLNIPNTKTEFELLIQLASLITQNIGVEFPELLTNISFTEKITDKMNVPYKIINTKLEFEIISEQIKKLGLTKTQQTHL
jgi:hypothetical protein